MKKLFIFLIIALLLLTGGYIVRFNFNKINADEFVGEKFFFIVKTDNIFKLFNKLDETGLLNSIFYNKSMKDIYTALIDVKGIMTGKSSAVFNFINSPALFVVDKNKRGIVIFDTGLKTPLYKITKVALSKFFVHSDKIKFSVSGYSNFKINKLLFVESGTSVYFARIKNILIAGLSRRDIVNHINIYLNNKGIVNNYNYLQVKSKISSKKLLNLFFNTKIFLKEIKKTAPKTYNGLKTVSIFSIGGMSFSFEKDKIIMSGFYSSDIKDEIAERLFLSSPRVLRITEFLPETVGSVIGVTFDSFKDVWEYYNRILILSDQQAEQKKIADIKSTIENVLNISFDKTLFSWMGTEFAKCDLSGFTDSLFLFSINDVNNIETTFENLKNKNIIKISDAGEYKGIVIKQLQPSPFFKFIADFITSKLNMPYYIIYKNYFIVSKSENVIKYFIDNGRKIFNDEKMRLLYDNNSSGNIIGYWNLNHRTPDFLKSDNLFSKIIKSYNYGSISVKFTDNGIESKIIITEPKKSKISIMSGWPVNIDSTVWKTPLLVNLDNKSFYEFLYATEKGEINVLNFWGENFVNWPIRIEKGVTTSPVIAKGMIGVVTDDGDVCLFDKAGIPFKNFPVHIDEDIACQPVAADIDNNGKDEIVFVTKENKIYAVDIVAGNNFPGFPVKMEYDLIGGIQLIDEVKTGKKDILYPTSAGDILSIDYSGKVVNDKILSTGEELFSKPVLFKSRGNKYILLVSKKGSLFVWNKDYKLLKGFPVYMEGKFLNSPVITDINNDGKYEILTVSADGELYFVNFSGEILFRKFLDIKPVKEEMILVKDVNHDKEKEIIIPCADNSIKFYNNNGNKLFEVEGITAPHIRDFDMDNKFEAITVSDNGKIFFYKLP